jgi:hypothetical protein
MAYIVFSNSRFQFISHSGFLAGFILFLSVLFVSGCADTPKQQIINSQYDYSIIVKGRSAYLVQNFINELKGSDGAQDVEIIELTDNFSEFRAWSQHDSGSMYNVIVSVLDKQGQHSKVSYSAKKFVIRNN